MPWRLPTLPQTLCQVLRIERLDAAPFAHCAHLAGLHAQTATARAPWRKNSTCDAHKSAHLDDAPQAPLKGFFAVLRRLAHLSYIIRAFGLQRYLPELLSMEKTVSTSLHGKVNKMKLCTSQSTLHVRHTLCTNRMRHFMPSRAAHWLTPKLLHICVAPQALSHAIKGGAALAALAGRVPGAAGQAGQPPNSPTCILLVRKPHIKQAHRHTRQAPGLKRDHSEEPTSTEGEMIAGPAPGPRRCRGQVQCKPGGRARENTCGGSASRAPTSGTNTTYADSLPMHQAKAAGSRCWLRSLRPNARNVGRIWRLITFCPCPNSAAAS